MLRFCFILLFIACSCSHSEMRDGKICQFPDSPQVVFEKGNTLLQYWDYEKDFMSSPSNFQNLKNLKKYQNAVKTKVNNLDQLALISRSYPFEKAGDKQNLDLARLLLKKNLRPMTCEEGLLLDLQGSRIDLVATPTEFLAFILTKANHKRLVYFTSNINGVRGLGIIHKTLEGFIDQGWVLEKNIHNHTLNINESNYRGVLAPSTSDAFVYQMELKDLKLQTAVITNGFETLEIDSKNFGKLSDKF